MDALKAEIAVKRKALAGDTERPSKYMRRGDVERLREELERKEREEKEAKQREERERKERQDEERRSAKVCTLVHRLHDPTHRQLEDRPPRLELGQSPPSPRGARARRPHRSPHLTSPTKKLSVVSEPRASPSGSSASPTRTAVFVFVRWNSLRRRIASGMAARMTSRRLWRMSRTWSVS